MPVLVATIQAKERQRDAARATVDALEAEEAVRASFDVADWLEETRELFEDARGTLTADPEAGRQLLRSVLRSPIVVRVDPEGGWSFECDAAFVSVPGAGDADVVAIPPSTLAKHARVETRAVIGKILDPGRRPLKMVPREGHAQPHVIELGGVA